jgi:hypothetical protein
MPKQMKHKRLRWLFVALSTIYAFCTFPIILFWIWALWESFFPTPKVTPIHWFESVKLAFDERVDLSTRLFQAALAILGAIWGLVAVKPADARVILKDAQERCLLVIATLVLLFSLYSHVVYVESMSHYALMASGSGHVPDIGHRDVAYPLISQYLTLLGGAFIGALVVASAKWVRGDAK